MRVTSKVGHLAFTFGHTRPFGSQIILYVCDGWTLTDGLMDGQKQRLLRPSLHAWG